MKNFQQIIHAQDDLHRHIYSIFGCSGSGAEEVSPASRVFSSQIPGYDGGEVDTNETVEIIFPLIVRMCIYNN